MLWVAAFTAQAVGFGRVSNTTSLGQPLNFEATVRLATDEVLTPECVAAEVFSGDNKLPGPLVRLQLDPGADGSERKVRVRTTSVIDEPVVTVLLTVGCEGKTTRKFVAFVDPPSLGLAQSSAVGEAPAEAPTAAANGASAAATSSPPSAEQPSSPAPATAAVTQPSTRSGGTSARAPSRRGTNVAGVAPVKRSKPAVFRSARAPVQSGSRLKLEPAAPIRTAKAAVPEAVAPAAPVVPVVPVAPPAAALPASGVRSPRRPRPRRSRHPICLPKSGPACRRLKKA
jgi:pilus assembly protein FimV